MTLSLYRILTGYVRFRMEGSGAERFLNAAAKFGAGIWDIKKKEHELYAAVPAGQYPFLRSCAKKTGVRLRITEKHGLPFQLHKLRRRKGVIFGAAAFVVVFYVLSLFVWSIGISGNTTLPADRILSAAEKCGLSAGVLKSEMDTKQIEQRMMLELPELSWVSLNTRGCSVVIELREKEKAPEIANPEDYCNLTASASGQVLRISTFAGESQVKVGDAVVQGQLLISGVVEDTQGNTTVKRASGIVVAQTERTLTAEIPLEQIVKEPTGEIIERSSLRIFGMLIPLTLSGTPEGDYCEEVSRTPWELNGVRLPISIDTEIWTGQKDRLVTYTMEQARQKAEEELAKQQEELPDGVTVLNVRSEDHSDSTVCRVTWVLTCEENIAVESKILVN